MLQFYVPEVTKVEEVYGKFLILIYCVENAVVVCANFFLFCLQWKQSWLILFGKHEIHYFIFYFCTVPSFCLKNANFIINSSFIYWMPRLGMFLSVPFSNRGWSKDGAKECYVISLFDPSWNANYQYEIPWRHLANIVLYELSFKSSINNQKLRSLLWLPFVEDLWKWVRTATP